MMIDRKLHPLASDWQETFLDTMKLAEERGCCVTMRSIIRNSEADVLTYGDAEVKAAFENFKSRAQEAFAYEAAHGKDSLLNLDHPLNVQLMEMDILRIEGVA